MKHVVRRRVMLALDIVMIALEAYALAHSWAESGAKLFRYYTQNSNILAMIVSIICLAQNIACLGRKSRMPGWTKKLRYLAASCLMLTLVIAGFFLVPTDSDLSFSSFMLQGKYLYLHTLCPVLMLVQLFVHAGPRLREKHALLALIPTVIYGAVSLMMNAWGVYSGPYPFLRVRSQEGYVTTVGCIAVLGVNYFISRVLAALSCIGRRPAQK